MKQSRNLREVQDEYKDTVVGLCIICEKPARGWYGRWGDLGSCSKKCEAIQETKPKYQQKGDGDGNAAIPSP